MIFVLKGNIILKFYDKNNFLFAELNYAKEFFSNYAKHSHDKLCISGLIEGKISVEFYQKTTQYIKPNQLIVFNPSQVHVCKNTDIKSYDYFTFHFDTLWIKGLALNNNIYFDENIINNKELYNQFISLSKDIIYNNKIDIETELKSLLINILQKYAINKIDINKENNLLYNIQKYILLNIKDKITLDELANELGYSKEHIIRIFKKEFGLSPHAFLMNAKVNKAKERLSHSSQENISELAIELGFCDQSHLNKFFKKSFGITPNDYKVT